MAIKGTDKVVVINQSADTTPRKSALINEKAKAQTVFDLTFSEPLAKGFDLAIPAIDAGAVEVLSFDMGDVGNPTSAVMVLYTNVITIDEIENFQRAAAAGFAPQRMNMIEQSQIPEITPTLSNKYTQESFPLSFGGLRITEDYTEARLGVQNQTNYASGASPYPAGFSYADYGVGSVIGWYSYFGASRGWAQLDKKVLLQSAWLEQNGTSTTAKVSLINIDTTANTPLNWRLGFYL